MKDRCILLSAMPTTVYSAEKLFRKNTPGSYAEEWLRLPHAHINGLIEKYSSSYIKLWDNVTSEIKLYGSAYKGDCTFVDFKSAINEYDVIILCAHHVIDKGIEFIDQLGSYEELRQAAPMKQKLFHLGICYSDKFINILKYKNPTTRIIASEGRVDPDFFISCAAKTMQLAKSSKLSYIDNFVNLRLEIFRNS